MKYDNVFMSEFAYLKHHRIDNLWVVFYEKKDI